MRLRIKLMGYFGVLELQLLIIITQMDKQESKLKEIDFKSSQPQTNQLQNRDSRKIARYKLQKMQSYSKFDIKGIIRLQKLQQKQTQIANSYCSSKYKNNFRTRSKTKQLDMIIPSFQAFNINSTFLPGFNQFQSQKRPKSQSRNARHMIKGTSVQENMNMTQLETQIEVKLPISETKHKIYWHRKAQDLSKQLYSDIHTKNQSQTQRKFRSKNVQNIIRRRVSMNFAQMISQYCRRMKINDQSKIFVFQSADLWLKQVLLQKGWVQNPDITSKIFHLKWTSKIPQQKADKNQMINHFYDSDLLTSKEGLAKVVKKSQTLQKFCPRSFDLGSELKQFTFNFNQTQILCCLKKIVREIQNNKVKPIQLLAKGVLKSAFKQLKTKQDYEAEETEHTIVIHIPYAIQLCAFCQNIRCDLQEQPREKQNCLNQKTFKNLFNFSLLNPPYSQYQSSRNSQPSNQPSKIHFNAEDINMYSSSKSFGHPSFMLIKLLCSYHSFFSQNMGTYRAEGLHNIWIVKNRNSSKGIGITLSSNFHELIKKTENKLVQKYIQDCVLYWPVGQNVGYKYDLRVWTLVTSFNPVLCYFYEQFYCRLCSEPYEFSNLGNPLSHLTNYSQNKDFFTQNEKNSIITYQNFIEMVSKQLGTSIEQAKIKINRKLNQIVFHTINAYNNSIKSHSECFQMFGFDIILSQSLGMHLLEVNLSPACTDRDPWLSANARKMASDLLNIVISHEKGTNWIPVSQPQ